MPNWTSTTYVFGSKEKDLIEDFQKKLASWTKDKSLLEDAWDGSPSWLGNILLHAGFEYNLKDHCFDDCRCRGSLEEIGEVQEEKGSRDETYFWFYISTETAWIPMPKMWQLIIEKLYSGKIEFGFFAVDECNEYIDIYNPELVRLIGIGPEDQYWFDSFINTVKYEEFDSIQDYYGENNATRLAEAISIILDRKITEEEIKDSTLREKLLFEANEKLSDLDENFYVNIREINTITPEEFE